MTTEGRVWLPAGCVYVPYLFEEEVEPFTHMPISTGLATGPDRGRCIEKGLLEILERDALMIVWYARLSTPRLDPESCRGVSPHVDALLDAPRFRSEPLVPQRLDPRRRRAHRQRFAHRRRRPTPTSFGIAVDPDPVNALRLALEEALLTRVLVNRTKLPEPPSDYSSIRTLRDHLFAHAASSTLRDRMRFLTDEGPEISFAAWCSRGTSCPASQALQAAGHEAFWVDVTPPDIAEQGLWTTRAIVPGMQPLDNDQRHCFLGGRRLTEVPAAMGRLVTLASLNTDPHPFP